jgi:hypothetical protein
MRNVLARPFLSGLAAVAVLLAGRLLLSPADAPTPSVPGAPHFQPAGAEVRAVLVTPEAERLPHKPGAVPVTLVEGTLPPDALYARVVTDEDCAPDAAGVSHCLNRLAVAGTEVAVRHHHRMHDVPCLSPGEVVRLVDRATYAAM